MDEEETERLKRMQHQFLAAAQAQQAAMQAQQTWMQQMGQMGQVQILPSDPQAREHLLQQIEMRQIAMQQALAQQALAHQQMMMQRYYGQQYGGMQNGQHWQSYSTLCGGPINSAYSAYPGWSTSGFAFLGPTVAADPCPPVEDAGIRAGEVEGFRAWTRDGNGALHSMVNSAVWPPDGIMRGDPDQAGYGVHAFKTADEVQHQYNSLHGYLAFGRVALWGRIVEHEIGYRAEFARITAIDAVTEAWAPEALVLRRLRRHYGLTGNE